MPDVAITCEHMKQPACPIMLTYPLHLAQAILDTSHFKQGLTVLAVKAAKALLITKRNFKIPKSTVRKHPTFLSQEFPTSLIPKN